ncbi:ribosome small subunit-dependent GTPase A [Myxococcota bacterium]|nr:ribosome small subunit-dependent GTPase A [Myxococcota bacterium]
MAERRRDRESQGKASGAGAASRRGGGERGAKGERSGKSSKGERGEKGGPAASGPGRSGRVVAHHGVAVLVRFDDDGSAGQVWLAPEQRAVVGDRVLVFGVRLETQPSHGVLRRMDPRGRERTIAVNLDRLYIVVAAEPREQPGYIDRGIVIARGAGIEPAIVVNKLDLPGSDALTERLREIYGRSCELFAVSAAERIGLDAIAGDLSGGRMGAMVGPSGVGKSSLLNALVPELALRVSELNRGSGHGRHTTTTATLHDLAGGGFLVDTAGFKDFIAVDVTPVEAAACFPGFEAALENGCRFRNCLHKSEPDCAVLAAAERGEIDERRLAAYSALLEELAASASRAGDGPSRKSSR